MALDSVFVEGALQNFVIFNELVLVLCLPLDPAVLEGAWEETVHDSAVYGRSGALLDLRDAQVEQLVEPLDQHLLAHEVGLVHHANRVVCHLFK